MTEVTANLDAALEMANKWRMATGQNILSAWMPAVKGNPNECLLARAFNSHCSVDYEQTDDNADAVGPTYERYSWRTGEQAPHRMIAGSGRIEFEDRGTNETFADVLGWPLVDEYDPSLGVTLPDEIALIAFQFDNGDFADLALDRDAELVF